MQEIEKIIIPNGFEGQRLDIVLMNLRRDLSRSQLKELIMDGDILCNGQRVKSNYRVSGGEVCTFNVGQSSQNLDSEDSYKLVPAYKDFGVVYEDSNTLIVDKPINISSHPANRTDHESMLNYVYGYLIKKDPKTKIIPKLVHRLDKPTSGLLLFAKNSASHYFYTRQFEQRKVNKFYIALVDADLLHDSRYPVGYIINHSLSRSKTENRYKVANENSNGVFASTKIVSKRMFKLKNNYYTVVGISPQTGRTHQIRLHLESIGYPILGDRRYGGAESKRLYLQANALEIEIFGLDKIQKFNSKLLF